MKRAIRKFKETVEIRSSVINRLRSHRYFPVGVFICASFVAACFHVWQRVKVMDLVKEISYLKAENTDLVDYTKKVYFEISSLKMVSRIERYACDTLGLEVVSANHIITLAPEKTETTQLGKLATLAAAFKIMSKYFPIVTPTNVNAADLHQLKIDSTAHEGMNE